MATTTSVNMVHLPHNAIPSTTSAGSKSKLERSQSASSSSTAHPIDSTESSKDEKASSSVSSSPTYQSNSSSSHHKTISTAVSSTNTAGSISPPPAAKSHLNNHKIYSSNTKTPLTKQSEELQSNQDSYSWELNGSNDTSRRQREAQSPSEQSLMSSNRSKKNEWNYERFDDDDDNDGRFSPFADEIMPMQYPPISEEEKEAKAIELNLERWASQEKQRRKALRTSRTASITVSSTAPPNKMSKRLSALNILGPKSALSPTYNREARMSMIRNNSDKIDGSWSSPKIPQERTSLEPERQASGDSEKAEEDEYVSKRSEKGKAKEGNNPFSDPIPSTSTSPTRRKSMKPTPRAPIVTPGKAPTIRHRALINAINSGGIGRMPSIVATDADEEKEAVRQIQELSIDPFQSAGEIDQQRQYVIARDAAKRTLLEGDEGGAQIITPPRPIMAPNRKSTSSSKFNEIGLNDDDDANISNDTADWLPTKNYEQHDTIVQIEQHSRPYWVQYLCGWAYMYPNDDEEQSGRTFPE